MKTVAALGAGIVLGAAGFLGAEAPCTPVAFVDINKVFKSYSRAARVQQEMLTEMEKSRAELSQREADLRKEMGDLEARFDPGTKEFEQGLKEIDARANSLKYDMKAADRITNRRQVKEMDAIYKEICAEAQRIAESKGCACLFNLDTEPITVENRGQVIQGSDLKLQMNLRTAVWAKGELDITRAVVAALEAAQEKGK
jgi:Skp family chaperone for outer membrane proteins